MKKTIVFALFVLLSVAYTPLFAQVYDLSTGIDNSTGLLQPLGANDDTWTICMPGNPWNNPASYVPVTCTSGIFGCPSCTTTYVGKDPSVRWLSPYPTSSWGHTYPSVDDGNDYFYRMTFTNNSCEILSASMCFDHIGADNVIDLIIINGNFHNVSYGFSPFSNNVCLTPAPAASEFAPGLNEIIVRVHNDDYFTGMEIKGNVTLVTNSTPPDPSFCLYVPTATSMSAVPSTPGGTHQWEVYMSPSGCPGSYTYVNTFYNYPELYMSGSEGSGPCYFVKHTVTTECGTTCAAQSACHQSCDVPPGCSFLGAPTNLKLDLSTNTLSWDPVPGAVSYIIEITVNDPECCRVMRDDDDDNVSYAPKSISVNGTSHVLNFAQDIGLDIIMGCYSWRVYAVCADGTRSLASRKFCANMGDEGWGWGLRQPDNTSGGTHTANKEDKIGSATDVATNGSINTFTISPNPAKGIVSFDIRTVSDMEIGITINDLSGKTVKTFDNIRSLSGNNRLIWDTGSIAKGTYMVIISTSDHKTISKKLVIE